MYDRYDLVIDSGADEVRIFKVVDECRNHVDMTGFKARMQIRPAKRSEELFDELTTENGRLEITEEGLTLRMPNSVTSEYEFCNGVYDIEVIATDETVTRIVEGRVTIRHGVTR